ncbi:hypothetical protein HK096_007503, partial [Nowakowskiella sp. JEL0078]
MDTLYHFPSFFGHPSSATPLSLQTKPSVSNKTPLSSPVTTPQSQQPPLQQSKSPLTQAGLILTTVPPTTSLAVYILTHLLLHAPARPWLQDFLSPEGVSVPPGLKQLAVIAAAAAGGKGISGGYGPTVFAGLMRYWKRVEVNLLYYRSNYAWA